MSWNTLSQLVHTAWEGGHSFRAVSLVLDKRLSVDKPLARCRVPVVGLDNKSLTHPFNQRTLGNNNCEHVRKDNGHRRVAVACGILFASPASRSR